MLKSIPELQAEYEKNSEQILAMHDRQNEILTQIKSQCTHPMIKPMVGFNFDESDARKKFKCTTCHSYTNEKGEEYK